MTGLVLDHGLAWQLACGGPFPSPDSLPDPHERAMALALQTAMSGVGQSSPNPPVGCVLFKGGRLIGQGVHTQAGGPHGEIKALLDAQARGEDPRGATAYVTLEPCCHHGRTPPCTDALLRAGIQRVIVGVRDPNPRVDGGGLAILQAHGIQVLEGVLGHACLDFHAPFFKLIRTGLPWVSLKLALGSDDALGPEGVSTAITSREVQLEAHALRRASDAMVVGRNTVAIDDPQLTDRWPEPAPLHRRFLRIVLDSHASLPHHLRFWASIPGQPALRAVVGEPRPLIGVEDLRLPPGPGGCSLRHLLHELGARGVARILFEGGATLAHQLLAEDLADECHFFRSEAPAGGSPLRLDLSRLQRLRASASFPGGRWDVHTR